MSPPNAPQTSASGASHVSPNGDAPEFIELLARSNFSFLQGASHPEELVMRAKTLGYLGLSLSDVNGFYGVVRGYQAAEKPSAFDAEQLAFANADGTPKAPFHYFCGVEVTPYDASPLVLIPLVKEGYVRLCRMLTAARRRAPKGHVVLSLKHVLEEASEDVMVFPLPPWKDDELKRIQEAFQDRVYIPVCKDFTWESIRYYQHALKIEASLGIPAFATQRPLFHEPERKPLHDVLTCILHKTTLTESATRLTLNRERYLKSRAELAHLFRERPDLLARTLEIAARVQFSLSELRYRYPQETLPIGKTPAAYLRDLVEEGVKRRYDFNKEKPGFEAKVRAQIESELSIIGTLEYEDYFLTLRDICEYAKSRGILYQGRGSAANSVVCFTIGLTNVDPVKLGLLFERFLSEERAEPPDIDIDFEHERREEVIQYIYGKYGERHAAMVCTVVSYRSRMAIREAAKAMGVPLAGIGALIKYMGREGLSNLRDIAQEKGIDVEPRSKPRHNRPAYDPSSRVMMEPPADTKPSTSRLPARHERVPQTASPRHTPDLSCFGLDEDRFQKLMVIAQEMQGFPRHLGIHTGGFVISHEPVVDIVPVEAATMEGRYVIQWNKDDIAALGLMKIDVLSLGMLTAIRKAFELLRQYRGIDFNMATVPQDDKPTYEMIQKADTVGVFQIESRAQMSLLPRLRPKDYYDLVIQVAIVRPGPIQGGMVHPYLKRRWGREPTTYAHPSLVPILEKTHGIPLFQEQVMRIAVVAAGFTPGESDELRRVVSSAWKRKAVMEGLRQRVINGMLANGIAVAYAEQIYKTIQGFASYGFPESHAASFALITYVSCYLRYRHTDVFTCALLNSQPMGFYSPRQLIADAQRHGVKFRPLDVQNSRWDYGIEPERRTDGGGDVLHVRVGLRSVYGLREAHVEKLVEERDAHGPYRDLSDLVKRTRLPRAMLVRLAGAGAFTALGLTPREALWTLQGMSFDPQSLFFGEASGLDAPRETHESKLLPAESEWDHMRREYQTKGFAVETHPLAILRRDLARSHDRYATAASLEKMRDRTPVRIAGLMSLLQKPGTAKGVAFLSMEDETGLMNVVVTPDIYEKFRLILLQAPLLDIQGRLESREGVRNVKAEIIRPLNIARTGEENSQIGDIHRGDRMLFHRH